MRTDAQALAANEVPAGGFMMASAQSYSSITHTWDLEAYGWDPQQARVILIS